MIKIVYDVFAWIHCFISKKVYILTMRIFIRLAQNFQQYATKFLTVCNEISNSMQQNFQQYITELPTVYKFSCILMKIKLISVKSFPEALSANFSCRHSTSALTNDAAKIFGCTYKASLLTLTKRLCSGGQRCFVS
jgi:hypothetical protein